MIDLESCFWPLDESKSNIWLSFQSLPVLGGNSCLLSCEMLQLVANCVCLLFDAGQVGKCVFRAFNRKQLFYLTRTDTIRTVRLNRNNVHAEV